MSLSAVGRLTRSRVVPHLAGLASLGLLLGIAMADDGPSSAPATSAEGQQAAAPAADPIELGRELFAREWLANDPRSHGGDGLGPVFNDSSCIACHNLGGAGGAGPNNKNVDILTAVSLREIQQAQMAPAFDITNTTTETLFRGLFGIGPQRPKTSKADMEQEKDEMAKLHPGFRSSRSVVLHHFGDADYLKWRMGVTGMGQFFGMGGMGGFPVNTIGNARGVDFDFQAADADPFAPATQVAGDPPVARAVAVDTPVAEPEEAAEAAQPQVVAQVAQQQVSQPTISTVEQARMQAMMQAQMRANTFSRQTQNGNVQLLVSQRNTTALFGVGLIDTIPDAAIEEAAARTHEEFPNVKGRVARLKDGKIGRFGWKAQKASLYDFAMTACAVELGLNVPDHSQAGLPHKADYKVPGIDMDQEECNALVSYIKALPAPAELRLEGKAAEPLATGEKLFAEVGCAACHIPKLGEVDGIYSDLLVHNMGQELGDTGDYGVFVPDLPEESQEPQHIPLTDANGKKIKSSKQPVIGATRLEWRTPALWGLRDSGPYLHDGRAGTIEEAVAFHGGEAVDSTRKFFSLSPEQRQQVTAFLKTLVAPEQLANR